jgi:hypothetical protein
MHQREAVDTLFRLMPQMEKDTPENVFVKYAAEKRLAPAQLARLGHVFNTASTNVTLKKDRNGRPTLIDVPEMVGSYVSGSGRSSKAAHESFLVEGDVPQTKAASAETPYSFSRGNVPDVWNGGRPTIEHQKVAHVTKPPDLKAAGHDAITLVDRALEEFGDKMAAYHEEIASICKVLSEDKAKLNEKLAMLDWDLGVPVLNSKMETDTIIGSVSDRFKKAGVDISIEDGRKHGTETVLRRDRTGQISKAAAAIDHLKGAITAKCAFQDGMGFLSEHEEELRKDPIFYRRFEKLAKQVEFQGLALGLFKEASALKAPSAGGHDKEMDEAGKELDEALEGENLRDARLGDAALSGGRLAMLAGGKLMHAGNRLVMDEIPGMVKEFTRDGELGQMLAPIGEENAATNKGHVLNREQIAKDTRAAALLQKLMIRDEVLSSKDPELVWQAFQSIRNSSPNIANDETMLKLLLRQATEIGGLDIDTGGAIRKYDDPKLRPGFKPTIA